MKSAVPVGEYVASGYFLSRHVDETDCTGIRLRRVTMAHDHTQRRFFPGAWALPWCRDTWAGRLRESGIFGIAEGELAPVMGWAEASFDSVFGAWNAFFTLGGARAAVRSFLRNATDLELWGLGLHHSLVRDFCERTAPPPSPPGYAPNGASGVHVATCLRPAALAEGGTVLGHELLKPDFGCTFASPESLHLDEEELIRSAGASVNAYGLIDSFDEGLACCRLLEAGSEEEHAVGWRPWLIVRFPL